MIIQGRSSVGSVGDRALNYQLNFRGFESSEKKEWTETNLFRVKELHSMGRLQDLPENIRLGWRWVRYKLVET
jgi:hypothetical protein